MPLTPEYIRQSAADAILNVDGGGVRIRSFKDATYMGRALPPGDWFIVSHDPGAIGFVRVHENGRATAYQADEVPANGSTADDFDAAIHLLISEAFPQ